MGQAEIREENLSYSADDIEFIGLLVGPTARTERVPGILIAHDGFGLSDHAKGAARRLADLGYAAFALDYLGEGKSFSNPAAAQEGMAPLIADQARVQSRIDAALALLVNRPEVDPTRTAAIGYCFGGTAMLDLARRGTPLRGVVGLHSGLKAAAGIERKPIAGKVLVCLGGDDPLVPVEERNAFEYEMRNAGIDWRMHVYGGVVHGFTNPAASAWGAPPVRYDAAADRRSWRETTDFLAEIFTG